MTDKHTHTHTYTLVGKGTVRLTHSLTLPPSLPKTHTSARAGFMFSWYHDSSRRTMCGFRCRALDSNPSWITSASVSTAARPNPLSSKPTVVRPISAKNTPSEQNETNKQKNPPGREWGESHEIQEQLLCVLLCACETHTSANTCTHPHTHAHIRTHPHPHTLHTSAHMYTHTLYTHVHTFAH